MPRVKSRRRNLSTKRGGINFSLTQSQPRQTTHSPKKSKQKLFPLLELPPEVLDIVLSYVIKVPWNPSNATFPDDAINGLFPGSVLQTNRSLRSRSLHFITHGCLWIRVEFLSRSLWKSFDRLECTVPDIPAIYRDILPVNLPGVRFVLGDPKRLSKQTRSFNTDTTSLLYPFNYQSFGALYGRITTLRYEVQSVKIELSTLPAYMRRIVDVQILPIVQLLRAYSHVSVLEQFGQMKSFDEEPSSLSKVVGQAQTLVSMVLALDAEECRLEGSIMCMYCGHMLTWSALVNDVVSSPLTWMRDERGIASSDWLVNPKNLERMRLVRALFYIESRALYTYLAGTDEYGYPFAKSHYNDVARLSLDAFPKHRWVDLRPGFWYGLPDHEAATMFHMKAFILRHNHNFIIHLFENDPRSPLIQELLQEGRISNPDAAYQALRAWNLDMNNSEYVVTLHDLVRLEPEILDDLRQQISYCEDVILRSVRRDNGPYDSDGNPNCAFRAQQLAWSADVAYDRRGEADIPSRRTGGQDLKVMKQLLGDGIPREVLDLHRDTGQPRTLLRWEFFDIDVRDMWDSYAEYQHGDIAPWHCWRPM